MSGHTRRPSIRPGHAQGWAGTTRVLLVAVVLLAGCATPAPSPSAVAGTTPDPSVAGEPGASPGATPGVTPLATGPVNPSGWARLGDTTLAVVARLEATRAGSASVAPTTAFRLRSLTDTPVAEMAARLSVSPHVELRLAAVDGRTATIRPAAPLRPGAIYHFELRRPDGGPEAAWAVQAAWPLGIDSTVPGDRQTGIPRDTGIEVTFDQPGIRLADVRDHVSISPSIAGRFEQHGRTFAFVPARPLARSTLYTLTVRRGLQVPETGMRLGSTRVIRFETTGSQASAIRVAPGRGLFDASTTERPVVGVSIASEGDGVKALKTLAVTVHRLAGQGAAVEAWRRVSAAPDWTVRTSSTPVRTSTLPTVLDATVAVRHDRDEWQGWFRLPSRLPAGWYVVTITHADIARQTILQVTDLAAFATATDGRTLVWVNDLATDRPVRGAIVTVAGARAGTTDRDGLLVARTPRTLLADADEGQASVVAIRSGGRRLFVPLPVRQWCAYCADAATDAWWHLVGQDRETYRTSDTVNVWGVIRDRQTSAVPSSVLLTLHASYEGTDAGLAPIASRTVSPDAAGAFLAQLSFRDVPPGSYMVSLTVHGEDVAGTWLTIGPIAKPAWALDLAIPHRAVVVGDPVTVNATGSFFEGTPVVGADLRYGLEDSDESDGSSGPPTIVTTDANGAATGVVSMTAGAADDDPAQWSTRNVVVRANEPEEGDVSASAQVVVFRSAAIVDLAPSLAGRRLTISGAVHAAALDRYDADPAVDPGSIDPRGVALAGRSVTIRVVDHLDVTRQTGTRYDFLAKRVVPVYETTTRSTTLPERTVTTGADGTYRLVLAVAGGEHYYAVSATHADAAGRGATAVEGAVTRGEPGNAPGGPGLVAVGSHASEDSWRVEYGIGEPVKVRFVPGLARAEASRHLFIVLARGLRTVHVQAGATFTTRFTEALLPAATISAVRFTGTGYEVVLEGLGAAFRTTDRRLGVGVTTDRSRYAPGDRALVRVQTLDAGGRPVPASVFVRVVDEKLFAIGAASVVDPLDSLYADTGTGVLATGWSHADPFAWAEDGKDTTGGGGEGGDVRADFRDWLLARLVQTGTDGRATLSVPLSDDLTSWRAVASAVTPSLEAGIGTGRIVVGLPFFAEAVVAPEYLTDERPSIRVRAYGSGLRTGDTVRFTVTSDTIPLAAVTADVAAFASVEVALPALPAGTHRLRIDATTPGRTPALTDSLVRTIAVVDTRTVRSHLTSVALAAGTTVGGADGTTTVTLVDAGRGRVVPLLQAAVIAEPYRADAAIAASVARDLLADGFGITDDAGLPEPAPQLFQVDGGIAVVPYGSPDLELSALAALAGDRRLDPQSLRQYLAGVEGVDGAPLTPSRALFRLLGRAALGDATLAEVREAAARTAMTVPERVTVTLAALAVGDEPLARSLYAGILSDAGERLGPWVRVQAGSPEETAVATARLAIVGAALGDPLAARMDAEVDAHPPTDTLVVLERVVAAARWAHRIPPASATAAITIDGTRREVTTTADEPVQLTVTPAQRRTLRIDPVNGSIIVTARWDGPVAAGDLAPPAGQSIDRTIAPASPIDPTRTVVVTFTVKLGPKADGGCWLVTDLAPSGLAPIGGSPRREARGEEDPGAVEPAEGPLRVVGQRVDFCVTPDTRRPVQTLRYLARVVTTGTYRWEAAVLQSTNVPDQGVVVPASEVTIATIRP